MAGKATFVIEGQDASARAFNSITARAKQTRDQINGFMKSAFAVTGIAAFTSKIVEAGKAAVELGDNINKAAIKAGIGGKQMSELAYAAKLADVDLSSLSTALKKMQVALSQAATGNKDAKGTLDALGVSLSQLQRLRPDEQFELLGDRISQLKDPADRARAATELFGKAGADLLPLFEQGATGIRKAREEAEKLGASLSDDTLRRLSELDDAGKRLSASWSGFSATLTAKVAPALTTVLDALSGTRAAELKQQIAFLEKQKGESFFAANPLGKYGSYKDIGTGFFSPTEGAAMLAKLQAQLDLIETSKYGLGGRGRSAAVPGFTAADAAAKAAEAAKKAAAASSKEMEKFIDGYHDSLRDMNADVDREANAALAKDGERWMKKQDDAAEWFDNYKKREKDLAEYREQQWQQTAGIFRDYFVNAFEDMINTGKFKWRGFLTFLVAEFAKKQFAKLFDSIFNSSSSSGGGWFGSILGAIVGGATNSGSASTIDGKASGGPVRAGKTYVVGERGMELFRPGSSGTITPNHALGGIYAPVSLSIDARGATVDAVKLLPAFGKQLIDQAEQRIVGRLRRDFYGLNQ